MGLGDGVFCNRTCFDSGSGGALIWSGAFSLQHLCSWRATCCLTRQSLPGLDFCWADTRVPVCKFCVHGLPRVCQAQLHVHRALGCGHLQPGWKGLSRLGKELTCCGAREALAIIITVLLSRLVLKKSQSPQPVPQKAKAASFKMMSWSAAMVPRRGSTPWWLRWLWLPCSSADQRPAEPPRSPTSLHMSKQRR